MCKAGGQSRPGRLTLSSRPPPPPPPEDSGSGLMNTLLNGHKVSVPPPRRTPGRERSGVFKLLGDQEPLLMG